MATDEAAQLKAIRDPKERAKASSEAITRHQDLIAEISLIRRVALEELVASGMTNAQIAAAVGMTSARVSQLLSTAHAEMSGGRPERAFFGSGDHLTIAVGGKWETNKPTPGAPSVYVSAPTSKAVDVIRKVTASFGIEAEYDVINPPGLVQLNRPDLMVLTSPRLLPVVGQALEADPHYGFASDARGWFLVDKRTGIEYRSPSEKDGGTIDYAYLGRLPRPDKRGSFLYLAGIHALGTLGAAHYLANNLPELWKKARSRRFSMLLACHYSATTHEITEVVPLASLERHRSR